MGEKHGAVVPFPIEELKDKYRAVYSFFKSQSSEEIDIASQDLISGLDDHETYPYNIGRYVAVKCFCYRHIHAEILEEMYKFVSANCYVAVERDDIWDDEVLKMMTCTIDAAYYQKHLIEAQERLEEALKDNIRLRRKLKEKGAEFGELLASLRSEDQEKVYGSIKRLLGDK